MTNVISTSAVQTSSKSYPNCLQPLKSLKKSVSIRDGIIPGGVERQLSSETYLIRLLSKSIFSNRLEILLFNIIQSMLHFLRLAFDFSYRFIVSEHKKKMWLRPYIDYSQWLYQIYLCDQGCSFSGWNDLPLRCIRRPLPSIYISYNRWVEESFSSVIYHYSDLSFESKELLRSEYRR